jgi:hypothetical protein
MSHWLACRDSDRQSCPRLPETEVTVPSLDKIPAVIDTLVTPVRNGELDEQLAQAKKPPVGPKSRRTA